MYVEKRIKQAIENIVGKDVNFVVEHPSDESHGDFSTNVCLVTYKQKGEKTPRAYADKLLLELKNDEILGKTIDLERISVAGPGFINFWLKVDWLIREAVGVEKDGKGYGRGDWGKGKVYEVEHTSPNPNKSMHLGHLRNNVTGMAVANLFEAGGVRVIRDAVDNNRGIAIAKLMWGYLKFARRDGKETDDLNYWFSHRGEWLTPEDHKIRPDLFVDELYVKGAEDFKVKEVEEKVRKLVVDWEAEDKATWALWKKVLDYSYKGQALTLVRLGNIWDRVWHEHEHYKEGKEWVEKGIKKKVFKVLPDGAVLTNLEKFGLTDTIVIKSDGTALYITQDLALTSLKKSTYKADKMFWVIGPEQSLDLKQMFAVCEQLGIGKMSEFTHIPYGYMSIKGQGKMSSRTGNVVYIDQLLDMARDEIKKVIKARDFSEKEIEDVSEKLGVGSVKYSILKVGRMTDMAFDLENSISFDGDSGPYLNYVYVRSVGVKNKMSEPGGVVSTNLSESEMDILRWIYRYPEVIESAASNLAPSMVCTYLFELAQRYNSFYAKNPIVDGGDYSGRRLRINNAVGQIIRNGMALLGIRVVERM